MVTNFTGLGFSNTGVSPPDSMGAVGPIHFVLLLNGTSNRNAIAVYDKAGGVVAMTNVLDFFRVETNYPGGHRMVDPRILFDHQSQRWVATALDGVPGSQHVILAVSSADDPSDLANGWSRYLLPVHGRASFTDFPTLGMDANGLYVSVLQSDSSTNSGHTVMAIKKPEIYQGNFVTKQFEIRNGPPVWTSSQL